VWPSVAGAGWSRIGRKSIPWVDVICTTLALVGLRRPLTRELCEIEPRYSAGGGLECGIKVLTLVAPTLTL
jgi:hypothetical protein